jgi:hypothetical protein
MNTKNAFLQNLPLLGLASSLLFLPMGATAAGTVFAVTGVLAVLHADYGRKIRLLAYTAQVIPFGTHDSHDIEMGEAA